MIVYCIMDAAPAPGFMLLPPLKPLLDLRCCQRLAGPRFWQCSALCLLSSLRQAKIYRVDSEVAVASHVSQVSPFARCNLLEGLPRKYISSFALEFLMELDSTQTLLALHNWP